MQITQNGVAYVTPKEKEIEFPNNDNKLRDMG